MSGATQSAVGDAGADVELRLMPNGHHGWYWEVLGAGRNVVSRGIADTQPAACEDAHDAARATGLVE